MSASAYDGHVYVDANANGILDKGEKPLAGVAVSDGLNVTLTDKNGAFTLPGHEREKFVFVTIPSGYMANDRHYIAISDSVDTYDFFLTPYNAGIGKDGSHKFIQLTDTEIFNTVNHEDWIKGIRDYADNEDAAFIIHTGDICYINGLKSHKGMMNSKNMHRPMFYMIGNHDLVAGEHGEDLFESIYGPVYFSFDVAGTHYIVTPMAGGDHAPGYTTADVAKWVKNDLAHVAPGTPVIVFNHNLPMYDDDFTYGKGNHAVKFSDHNIKAWIYGHWHINHARKQGNAISVCTSTPDKGGIDHSQSSFRVYDVAKNGDVTMQLRYPYLDRHIAVAAPQGCTASTAVVANAYDTASPVEEMTYTLYCDGKPVGASKKMAKATDWTWTANMADADKFAGKEMDIRVSALLKDGRRIETDSKFVYDKSAADVQVSGNWTNLRGNATHTAEAENCDMTSAPVLAWTSNVGGNVYMTSPVVCDGIVYTATLDEDLKGEAAVVALDAATGKQIWKYELPASVKNSIAVEGGLVFAQDVLGKLYAIDGRTGALRWSDQMPVSFLPALIDGLVADNGIVYAGSGHGLSAYNAATGKLLWRNKDWGQGEGTTSTLTLADNVLLGNVQWTALHANDATNGKKLWSLSENGLSNRGASAAIYNGLIYIISNKSVFVIEPKSGRIIVRKEMPYNLDVTSSPLLTDKLIVFGTADRGVVALDSKTLEPAWNFLTDDALVYTAPYTRTFSATVETSPVKAGDVICVAASDGTVYGIDASTGRRAWKYSTGAPIFGTPAFTGNTMIFSDYGGNVYALSGRK